MRLQRMLYRRTMSKDMLCAKSIEIEVVFTKAEINNEQNVLFFKIRAVLKNYQD